jgi:hypothetical protein
MSAPTPETPPVETPPVVVPPAPETPPPPPEGGGQQPDPEVFDKTYVEKLRRENAGYRTKAQENAEAARKLKEIEDRDLSELQKAQRDREEALTRLQAIEREALRNRVALAKGLPRRSPRPSPARARKSWPRMRTRSSHGGATSRRPHPGRTPARDRAL